MDCLDLGALRAVFELLQMHYPERQGARHFPACTAHLVLSACMGECVCLRRLGVIYMLDAPTIFWALWKAVGPFIDPETKKKVRFVSAKGAAQEFNELFGEVRESLITAVAIY